MEFIGKYARVEGPDHEMEDDASGDEVNETNFQDQELTNYRLMNVTKDLIEAVTKDLIEAVSRYRYQPISGTGA